MMQKGISRITVAAWGFGIAFMLLIGAEGAAVTPDQNGNESKNLQVARKDKEKKVPKTEWQEIRKERSRPEALQFDLKKSQPIFVKVLDASTTTLFGQKPTTDEDAKRETKILAEQIQYKTIDQLKQRRFDAKPYPEDASKADVKDALVIDGKLDKITFGKKYVLCAVKIMVHPQNDAKTVLAQYEDGGDTGSLGERLATRFDKTAKE